MIVTRRFEEVFAYTSTPNVFSHVLAFLEDKDLGKMIFLSSNLYKSVFGDKESCLKSNIETSIILRRSITLRSYKFCRDNFNTEVSLKFDASRSGVTKEQLEEILKKFKTLTKINLRGGGCSGLPIAEIFTNRTTLVDLTLDGGKDLTNEALAVIVENQPQLKALRIFDGYAIGQISLLNQLKDLSYLFMRNVRNNTTPEFDSLYLPSLTSFQMQNGTYYTSTCTLIAFLSRHRTKLTQLELSYTGCRDEDVIGIFYEHRDTLKLFKGAHLSKDTQCQFKRRFPWIKILTDEPFPEPSL